MTPAPDGDGCARPARAEARILEATLSELADHGFAGLTVEGVAGRACVGRATIYRHWSSRADLVMAAVRSIPVHAEQPDTGNIRDDLVLQIGGLVEALATTALGTILPALIEAAHRDTELAALHATLIDERRGAATSLLTRAVERGELPPDVNGDVLLDLVVGLVFYRHLVRRRPVASDEVPGLVDAALAAVRR